MTTIDSSSSQLGTEERASASKPMGPARFWVAVLACLAGIAILATLGSWQVERLAWKEGLLRSIAERTQSPPAGLPAIEQRFSASGDVDYWRVRLSGRFLHEEERHFLTTFKGEAGWNVYTPLRLAGGRLIFVNRGFVPYARKDPATRAAGRVDGEAAIVGIARNASAAKPGSMLPDNDPAKNVFFWKSLAELAVGLPPEDAARLLPFIVDAGPGEAPGGFPVGGTTVVDIPNSHLAYAVTWYGLAAVLAVMLAMLVFGRIRPARIAS